MRLKFTVEVETEHVSGKFISRDEACEQIADAIEGADPGEISGGADGDSVASIIQFEVSEEVS